MGNHLATTDMGRKRQVLCPFQGKLGPHLTQCRRGPRPTSVPSGILIPPAIWPQYMGRKSGAAVPLFWVELGPHLTQCCLGQGPPPYQVASWSTQPYGHNRHWLKIGEGLCPFGRGVLGPHLTQCARAEAHHHAMFHLYPSNHLATLHQCYRQTGQDNGPIAYGEPF